MPFELTDDQDAYCYLRTRLTAPYRAVAEPVADYFSEQKFCYRVYRDDHLLCEFKGDFRTLPQGKLVRQVRSLLDSLNFTGSQVTQQRNADAPAAQFPYASRRPPKTHPTTWFSSGRAAFAFLMSHVVRPRRIYLPTLICWSLLDVLRSRFPDVDVRFYDVCADLTCVWPEEVEPDACLLLIHYFGHRSPEPKTCRGAILEDCSHMLFTANDGSHAVGGRHCFGSLRKAYHVADGGFLHGRFNPEYEADAHRSAWLRQQAVDWRDLREAENMTDRNWFMSDISSQSLSVVLQTSNERVRQKRRENNSFLQQHFSGGQSVVDFREQETPLLHCRVFESTCERDSLRQFLASQQYFTSVHWPMHPWVERQDCDQTGPRMMQNRSLAFPVSDEFGERELTGLCDAVRTWRQAGAARFSSQVAG